MRITKRDLNSAYGSIVEHEDTKQDPHRGTHGKRETCACECIHSHKRYQDTRGNARCVNCNCVEAVAA